MLFTIGGESVRFVGNRSDISTSDRLTMVVNAEVRNHPDRGSRNYFKFIIGTASLTFILKSDKLGDWRRSGLCECRLV